MRRIRKLDKKQENNCDEYNPEEIQIDNDIVLERISKAYNFEKFYYIINESFYFFIRAITFLFKVSGVYFLWICLHYFSAHLYIKFCVPSNIFGFLMSPFMVSTPHCQGLRWIVYNAASVINNMWILVGAWVYSIIWILRENSNDTTSGL